MKKKTDDIQSSLGKTLRRGINRLRLRSGIFIKFYEQVRQFAVNESEASIKATKISLTGDYENSSFSYVFCQVTSILVQQYTIVISL